MRIVENVTMRHPENMTSNANACAEKEKNGGRGIGVKH
jgi:hypothetical protein